MMKTELIQESMENGVRTIALYGHITSTNAPQLEQEIAKARAQEKEQKLVLDATHLEYISSAGLRVVLRLKKEVKDISVIQCSPEVYDVFEMTGFTEMMDIRKAYRTISVEGCEAIGQGANGTVYRIDAETIVKVYNNPDALPDIQRERELARTAFVLGIPTAISYDVVRVGDGYGSVFELLNATNLSKMIQRGEKTLDEVAKINIDLLHLIHGTLVKPGVMPDMREVALDWVRFLKPYVEENLYAKLYSLVEAVPQDYHMMHGDYHIKNVMVQNGEVLLIDMDTLCTGHPVFELASMYNAYLGYSELDHENIKKFLGLDYETAGEFWHLCLEKYLNTKDEAVIRSVEDKAKVVGYVRIMRRTIRRAGFETEHGRAVIENAHQHLRELAAKVDRLTF
ncbi:MAG: anti-sigma factor antagonist [Lachnospiraceae bacterium]|nr:anti-sigma factor antagonist [Lachnospiraceae bacterium]